MTGSTIEQTVCAANAYLATLTTDQLATGNLDFTDSVSKTKWSNLPIKLKARAGIAMGDLGAESQAAALALMDIVLSETGKIDLGGVRAADEYLATLNQDYGAGMYYITIFGTPSTTGQWSILFTGHHLALNIYFDAGAAYTTPQHISSEPKAEFKGVDGLTYAPIADEMATLDALFASLTPDQLTTAYLSGQSFMDYLQGPNEYATGSLDQVQAKYPTGANRTGVLVSTLGTEQQALVTAAIAAWVGDFNEDFSSAILAEYTSDEAYADTYVAFGGSSASGVETETKGNYMRIDGPRVWLEASVQGGIVFPDVSHPHMIFRDKQFDYGGSL